MKPDLNDILIFIGIAILCAGLWLISPAISLCVLGILMTLFGLFGALIKTNVQRGGEKT